MRSPWLPRAMWAIVGLLWFFWLGYEDRNTTVVLAIAALFGVATLLTIWLLRPLAIAGSWRLLAAAASGALLGAGIPLWATVLVFLKVSLHNHPVPDFTFEQIRQLLALVPVWSVVGLLTGAALGLSEPLRKAADVASPHRVAYNDVDDEWGED